VTEDVFSEYPIEEHNWAAAAEVADSLGVDVISSSLGYSLFDDPSFNYSYADMNGKTTMVSRAAEMASSKGMLVCNSAGNAGQKDWYYITAPGDADGIITVGATDSTRTFTAFSSHGPTADGRIKPNAVAQGIKAWVIDPAVENNTTFPGSGTSFANPIVAGLAACLWQAHPNKSNLEIIDAIERSAHLYFTPNDSFGYGIPNFQVADLILSDQAPDDLQLTKPVLYPNPFDDQFGILYYAAADAPTDVTVDVIDMIGRKVFSLQSTIEAGYNYLPVTELADAANGAYFVRVNFGNRTDVFRAIKSSR
jgi:subtilisin family serine protease